MDILSRILGWNQNGDQQPNVETELTSAPNQQCWVQVDQPISSTAEDIFDRASFSRQIAETIARRADPSSLVVGIYGPWGDGKTSTLSMVKECLEPNPDIITMDYNPWFYGDSTEAITRSFFYSIKDKLEKSGWFSKEKIGELLTYGGGIPRVGDTLQKVGQSMTTERLIETRDKVGKILKKHGKKIVIFVDDIDRLDRKDIQTLFKLVRLSGNFDHTTYVLAFDEQIVAQALGEAYASGDATPGSRFLEKIVQVPLHLPPASPAKLRDLMFAACDRVAAENKIKLKESDGPELGHALVEAFGSVLRTPRRVKLFDNAITFAVPVLVSEVRFIDQILIEALRVFYPTVYDAIRRNPSDVLKNRRNMYLENPLPLSPVDKAIASLDAEESEKKAVTALVHELFPRTGGMEYGSDWDTSWASEKRICSGDYFPRYFTYAVPTGDVSDQQIDIMLGLAGEGNQAKVQALLRETYEQGAAEILIRKLRHREESLDLATAPILISAIAKCASDIPVTGDVMFGTFTRSQAAILICRIVSRMDAPDQDENLSAVADQADSLPFICELIRFSHMRESRGEESGFLSPERVQPIAATLLRRLVTKADECGSDVITVAGADFGVIAYSVVAHGNAATKAELRGRLAALLDADPSNALSLIKALAGKSQGGDGVVRIADFTGETYESVGKLLDRNRVFEQLREKFGERLDSAKWSDDGDVAQDIDQRIANQFAAIHIDESSETHD